MNTFGITELPTYLLGTALVILLPGPNSLFVLAVASRQGMRDGYRAALGVLTGDAILMTAVVAGVGPLLAAMPGVFTALKLGGALYLVWMGIGLLRAAWARWRSRSLLDSMAAEPAFVRNPFRRVIGICLLNPKAILFFISFFIQFVDPAYPYPALSFAVLGLLLELISLSYLSLLIVAGAGLARALHSHPRLAAGATGGAGLLFIGFGARLAAP